AAHSCLLLYSLSTAALNCVSPNVFRQRKPVPPERCSQLRNSYACNDYLVSHYATIPIVNRLSAAGRRADLINTNPTPWDFDTWNIAYWQLKK
ncbi:MAG: hypothetical protein ACR2M3_18140, partial [Thermomicrobiales bacterium]